MPVSKYLLFLIFCDFNLGILFFQKHRMVMIATKVPEASGESVH